MTKNPPANIVGVLAQVSGISKPEIMDIWAEVKANSAKREACPRHVFAGGDVKMGQKVTCLACGATMSLVEAGFYIKGFKAAGGDPNAIWPGWNKEKNR